MMIVVAILAESGVFQWVGIKATKMSGGNLWKLMLILCTFTAIVSMFIDNVTTILLMIPVTVSVFRTVGMSEKHGHPIGFNRWFKIGFPFMLVTVAVGTAVLSVQIILHY
jgi:Na+/H+ antiporter NhaD/arsenite permease-like protein